MFDLIAAACFSVVEFLFPNSTSRFFKGRSGVLQDVLWYATNQGMGRLVSALSLALLLPTWRLHAISAPWLQHVAFPFQLLMAILLVDFCAWITHYLLHRIPFLWRFHKLHHSSESMDWLAGFRSYWLDAMTLDFFGSLPLILIPFEPRVWSVAYFWILINAFVSHANFGFRPRWVSDWISLWPSHRVHHLASLHRPYGQNFGTFTLIWDHILGTYVSDLSLRGKEVYGLPKGERYPKGYFARIIYPFSPKALVARVERSLP